MTDRWDYCAADRCIKRFKTGHGKRFCSNACKQAQALVERNAWIYREMERKQLSGEIEFAKARRK